MNSFPFILVLVVPAKAAGGPFRSPPGRVLFPATDLSQNLSPPDNLRNQVDFRFLGLMEGAVSLQGRFEPIGTDEIQINFQRPQLRIGSWSSLIGPESQTQIRLVYLDERVRLGRGRRGALFVFVRRGVETPDFTPVFAFFFVSFIPLTFFLSSVLYYVFPFCR